MYVLRVGSLEVDFKLQNIAERKSRPFLILLHALLYQNGFKLCFEVNNVAIIYSIVIQNKKSKLEFSNELFRSLCYK